MKMRILTVVTILSAAFTQLVPVAAAQTATYSCMGRNATMVGTNGSDVLRGTSGVDVIVARGGADEVHGLGSRDFICAGGGKDTIYAGGGSDKVNGGSGDDLLVAGTKKSLLAPGEDLLQGGDGSDIIIGGPGDDWMRGGTGVDALLGITGDDVYDGGAQIDVAAFLVAGQGVTVDLAEGSASGEGNDTLQSIQGVMGSPYQDFLYGNSSSNYFWGHGGHDDIYGRGGADSMLFGLAQGPVSANLATQFAQGEGYDYINSIENLVGSDYDDQLTGDAKNNYLDGAGGADEIQGGGGSDACFGETLTDCPPNTQASQTGNLPNGGPPAPAPDQFAASALSTQLRMADNTQSIAAATGGYGLIRCMTGYSGAWVTYPTFEVDYGRLAVRARYQNGSVWSDWSVHRWQYYNSYNRWYYNNGWVLHNYEQEWISSAPGTIIDAWWQPGDGAQWYQIGSCLVEHAVATGGIVGLGVYMVPR